MPWLRERLVACTLAVLVLVLPAGPLWAQDADAKPSSEESQARLRRAAEHMRAFAMRIAEASENPSAKPTTEPKVAQKTDDAAKRDDTKRDDTKRDNTKRDNTKRDNTKRDNVVELIDRPLLTYGDSARANENGTLWAFGRTGRPLAFLELYQPRTRGNWVHAVTLTSEKRVVMTTPARARWAPEKTDVEPAPIPDAAAPHAKESLRTRQMKDLARRFTAHEFWNPDNSRFELRLLVQPVHRYSDAKTGLHDGAAFVLAHGTNPEVILLIEALGPKLDEARWHYGLARLGSAEMHVELDGKEVWKRERTPGVVGKSSDPYWLFFTPVEADE